MLFLKIISVEYFHLIALFVQFSHSKSGQVVSSQVYYIDSSSTRYSCLAYEE